MKNLVLFLLSGIVLFGLELQQANFNPTDFDNAKKINYIDANPAQITLKIPLDLDESLIGEQVGDSVMEGYRITCWVFPSDRGSSRHFYTYAEIVLGSKIITMKFNGIPLENLLKLDYYRCQVNLVKSDGYDLMSHVEGMLLNLNNNVTGELK